MLGGAGVDASGYTETHIGNAGTTFHAQAGAEQAEKRKFARYFITCIHIKVDTCVVFAPAVQFC
ncbi:hypothetical protein KIMH_01270 [Bombiscardovia apis]|uniref:Uncharacterized protein n=1 Tax=Bombiscardovia apis TaxID=2932182 RepID=A0ABN6SFL8_9BIFI|nr:hypothetical protein KIMH_01270 [Bombiscardovia apis]